MKKIGLAKIQNYMKYILLIEINNFNNNIRL